MHRAFAWSRSRYPRAPLRCGRAYRAERYPAAALELRHSRNAPRCATPWSPRPARPHVGWASHGEFTANRAWRGNPREPLTERGHRNGVAVEDTRDLGFDRLVLAEVLRPRRFGFEHFRGARVTYHVEFH